MNFRLADFGVDLTARARAGQLDPVIGREKEIARTIRILARKTKNNPVLIGEPGVGKTAIAEALAHRIVDGTVPRDLADITLFSLNLGSLLAGTGYRGDFEQRLQQLIVELRRPGVRRLLFVDELHLIGRAGKSEGGLDAGNLLKPLLARGELPCIGASTPAEWAGMVARDPALERRFQPVEVGEPTADETLAMLRGLRDRFERHHNVEITDEALQAAVDQSIATMPNRRLPDKAIDLLDEACAMLRLGAAVAPDTNQIATEQELATAMDRYDLESVARLKAVMRTIDRRISSPRLDSSAIQQVCSPLMSGSIAPRLDPELGYARKAP
jgi:ATP-dependent Clp protease ATP-binding subunit ClpA